MTEGRIGRLAGGGSLRTLIQLVIASVVVGAFLAFWGVSPGEFWSGVFNFIRGIVGWLGDSVGEIVVNLLTYLLFGAAIVVPIWLIMRVIGGRGAARRD
ncbi:MAG: integrase [Parvularculaceae bacterium]|nr:integrase [Parvularculaceae bacterium]